MPLLELITHQSLDADYLVAAEKRVAGGPSGSRRRGLGVATAVVGVFGLLAATAFVQTSRDADADQASRTTLISRIGDERARVAEGQEESARLLEANTSLEDTVRTLAADEQTTEAQQRRLKARTGFLAVTGPGITVVVTQVDDADDNQVVQDGDLQLLVNGLFEAGAEAVAVNGQRIAAGTAIRVSGDAIEVNGVGIAPPYTLEAIGDRRTLPARLFETTSGLQFAGIASRFGIGYEVSATDELMLSAAPGRLQRLRTATRLQDDQESPESSTRAGSGGDADESAAGGPAAGEDAS
ncbi:MAG: hypothetical protein CMH83_23450 [Nocardioides sp.]|nr:hypothetical protein [Nocardioides sp.]